MSLDRQIDRQTPRSWRKGRALVKRYTSRRARRLGKAFLEDAPPRRTRGWVS